MTSILDVEFEDMQGNSQTLRKLGKEDTTKWLVVNVASDCGFTKQYVGLQTVSLKDDVTVVGFPCNQFAGQESGTNEEICQFTSEKYGVTFPLMAKVEVNGTNQANLFQSLTAITGMDGHEGAIRWNFEKFLIDLNGNITRYAPQIRIENVL